MSDTDPFTSLLGSEKDKSEVKAAMEEMERQSEPEVSEDPSDLFGDEHMEWHIPTGRFTEEGRPKVFRVTVKDPMDSALPTKYFLAMQRDPKGAIRALWKSCVVQPRSICDDDDVYNRLSSSFRMAMNLRLLELIGVNQDFLEAAQGVSSGRRAPQPRKTSSGKSPANGAATPETSSPGLEPTSTTPTPTSSPDESKNAEPSSPTSATSLDAPSEGSAPQASVIPSKTSGEATLLGRTPT